VEFAAELLLAPCHLAVVALMVVAAQMENSVQDKNFNFYAGVVPESTRILGGDFGGDGDVTGKAFIGIGRGGERKHVRRLIFSAEAAVQGFHLGVRGDEHIDRTVQAGGSACAGDEANERQFGQSDNGLLENYQVTSVAKASM